MTDVVELLVYPSPMLKGIWQLRANVKELIRVRGFTQQEVAIAAEVDATTFSKFLNGKDEREIQLWQLDKIAELFDMAVYELYLPYLPGVHAERRKGDRRSGRDRRVLAARNAHPTTPHRQRSLR